MYAGQLLEEGGVEEIFNNPRHPYTRKLLGSVPRLDMDRSETLHSIDGTPPDLYIPPKGCPFSIDVMMLWLSVKTICQKGNTTQILIIVVVG